MLFCGYGTTETTSMCSYSQISHEDIVNGVVVTIGKPTYGFEIYILDDNLHPVPVGTIGEIFIAG